MRKICIYLLAASVVIGTLALVSFPTYAEKNRVKLILWHMEARPHRVKRFGEVLDKFIKTHPNIVIEQQVQGWGEAYIKTLAAIQAGKAPDLLFTIPDFTTSIKMTGAVQPVDEIVQHLKRKYTFIESSLRPYRYEGHYWAIPLYGMDVVLWYRSDLFLKAGLNPEDPPRSWTDLLNTAKKLVNSGVVKNAIAVPGARHMSTEQCVYPLMVTNKAQHLFGEKKEEIVFDNPRTVAAYAFYKKLFDLSPPGSADWRWDEPRRAFFTGEVALVLEKGHYLKGWEDKAGLPADYLAGAPVPVPKDGQPGTIYYSNGVMLLTRDKEKRAAFKEFMDYLFEPETMGWFITAAPGFFLPVTEEASRAESFWSDPVVKKNTRKVKLQIEQSKYGELFGFTRAEVNPYIGRISARNLLAWTAQKITVEGLSPAEAVKLGAEEMRKAIR